MEKHTFSFIKHLAMGAVVALCTACSGKESNEPTPAPKPTPVSKEFYTGADVSWITQLESEGHKFKDATGRESECMTLLRDHCGVNAIRLRVWVNPANGWCGTEDVKQKAVRAKSLGLPVMIDFHFSETWADAGQQAIPSGWSADLEGVKKGMTAHITDVLGALKAAGVTPKWVQVGNETANGMLWPLGQIDVKGNHFAELITHATRAVKSICPDAKVIVHTDQGDNYGRYDWVYGPLKEVRAEYDMIGVSFYPELTWDKGWLDLTEAQKVDQLFDNVAQAHRKYGKEVMIVEFGMQVDRETDAQKILTQVVNRAKGSDYINGVFYWEPEAPRGYNGGYDKGCFVNGTPTRVLEAFR